MKGFSHTFSHHLNFFICTLTYVTKSPLIYLTLWKVMPQIEAINFSQFAFLMSEFQTYLYIHNSRPSTLFLLYRTLTLFQSFPLHPPRAAQVPVRGRVQPQPHLHAELRRHGLGREQQERAADPFGFNGCVVGKRAADIALHGFELFT